MKTLRHALTVLALAGLAACGKPPAAPAAASPTPASAATPEPGYAGIPEASGAVPTAAPLGVVEAPDKVNTDAADAVNQQVKTEVLARIDVMPNLKPEEKDKLYVQVERARGMGKIVTIPFASGKKTVGLAEAAALQEKIKLPQLQAFTDDPTVVFVVLGYADTKGDPKGNLAISLERAESVVAVLKKQAGVMNVVQAVGMGGSELFDAKNLDKNRVVEVWAVLP